MRNVHKTTGKNVLDTVDLEPLWCCVLCREERQRERNSVQSLSVVRRTDEAQGRVV